MLTRGVMIYAPRKMCLSGGARFGPFDIDDEIPGWLRVAGEVLMIIASMGKELVSVAKLELTQGLETAGPFGVTFATSSVAGI